MSNIIVMAFSPRNIVGCLLKKGLQRGGGVTGSPGPPSLRPCNDQSLAKKVKSYDPSGPLLPELNPVSAA